MTPGHQDSSHRDTVNTHGMPQHSTYHQAGSTDALHSSCRFDQHGSNQVPTLPRKRQTNFISTRLRISNRSCPKPLRAPNRANRSPDDTACTVHFPTGHIPIGDKIREEDRGLLKRKRPLCTPIWFERTHRRGVIHATGITDFLSSAK